MRFKVHFEHDYQRQAQIVTADTPEKAANIIRKRFEGAKVIKTKVDKSIPDES